MVKLHFADGFNTETRIFCLQVFIHVSLSSDIIYIVSYTMMLIEIKTMYQKTKKNSAEIFMKSYI